MQIQLSGSSEAPARPAQCQCLVFIFTNIYIYIYICKYIYVRQSTETGLLLLRQGLSLVGLVLGGFVVCLRRRQDDQLRRHGILGECHRLRDSAARSISCVKVGGRDANAAEAVAIGGRQAARGALTQQLQLALGQVGFVFAATTRCSCLDVAACRVTMESNISGFSATTQEFLKFFTEVIVEPSIEQRIRAGRAHANHVAYGIRHNHSRRDGRGPLHVRVQIDEVQRQPRNPENDRNANQQSIRPLHSPAPLRLALRRALHGDHGDAALQLVVDAEVGDRHYHYGHQILHAQRKDRVVEAAIAHRPVLDAVRYPVGHSELLQHQRHVHVDQLLVDEQRRGQNQGECPNAGQYGHSSDELQTVPRGIDNYLGNG